MRDGELLGWSTGLLVALDELAPGLIRRVVVAAPIVRQAIFLTLAHWSALPTFGPEAPSRSVATSTAETLRSGRAKDIVAHQFGAVPEGLLGALERIGPNPLHEPHCYARLWAFFTDRDRRKATALREVGKTTASALWVLDTLDPLLLHAEVLKRIETVQQAHDLNRSIRLLKSVCSAATDEAISRAIAGMRGPEALSRLVHRFLRRADRFPPHPIVGDHELRPLTSAREFIEASRAYRNCLATMIGEALMGRVAFAELATASVNAICEFRPLSGGCGWLLTDVHTARNGIVSTDLRETAQQKCAEVGVPHIAVPEAHDWRSVRRMVRRADPFAFAA